VPRTLYKRLHKVRALWIATAHAKNEPTTEFRAIGVLPIGYNILLKIVQHYKLICS